jgi:hypothetical protein
MQRVPCCNSVDDQPAAASLSALAQVLLSDSPASATEISQHAAADTGDSWLGAEAAAADGAVCHAVFDELHETL